MIKALDLGFHEKIDAKYDLESYCKKYGVEGSGIDLARVEGLSLDIDETLRSSLLSSRSETQKPEEQRLEKYT